MGRAELTNPRRRLPDLSLPAAPEGNLQPVRAPGRRAPVLVLLHGSTCAACRDYVDLLASAHAALQEWGGSVGVLLPEPISDANQFHEQRRLPFPVLADPEQRLVRASQVAPPALVIADQWGEIHHVTVAGPEHAWPSPAEVTEWLRFLAMQCPECEGEAL